MNELLNELLTLLDQNVIRIQPYTLEDSERASIQARIDDWTRRARVTVMPIASEIDQHNAAYFGLPLYRMPEHNRLMEMPINQWPKSLQSYLAVAHGTEAVCGDALACWVAEWLKQQLPDPQHCYLCDRPRLDCACEVNHAV